MEKKIEFKTELERENYIYLIQNYAKQKMTEFKNEKISNNENYNYDVERQIAILSYIATKPQFIDKQLVDKSLTIYIKKFEFNPLFGFGGLAKGKTISIAETPRFENFYVNDEMFGTLLHEMIHILSYNNDKNMNALEAFFEEGLTDNKTEDILASSEFRALCKEFNYKPKLWGSGYQLERAITGIMDLATSGKMEESHTIGSKDIQILLDADSGFEPNEKCKDNITRLISYRNILKNDIASPKRKALLMQVFPYTAYKCFMQFAKMIDGKELNAEQIVKLHRYENEIKSFFLIDALKIMSPLSKDNTEVYLKKANEYLNEIHEFCSPFYSKLDLEPTKQILEQAKHFNCNSNIKTIIKQMELLEKSGLTTTDAVANLTYNNLKEIYDNFTIIQQTLKNKLPEFKEQSNKNMVIQKCVIDSKHQADKRITKMLKKIEGNQHFSMFEEINQNMKELFEIKNEIHDKGF